ncbi:hypothetical protein THIX_60460 [Thiomonas sp. X19]|uniref:hypothetical protein n=1 Tax=Thiomonas sp. X19 TaxID=1050370 RepID=UPI000B6777EC|nr:hypothetical protein [Thiomonas sp. X19]SCC94402.1 hypothetical protein THIX_60460 [Thiomonas sp. X19]
MIAHMILSAVIHGLVYDLIFKAFRGLPLSTVALIAIVGIGGIWLLASAARLLRRLLRHTRR